MNEEIKRGPGRPSNAERAAAEAVPVRARPAKNVFGQQRQKLSYDSRPGYHRHWFNDAGNRIGDAKTAGYEHVLDHEGKPVNRRVGTSEGGGPLIAFLMEIPQEWYDEDMKEQEAAREALMEQIRRSGGTDIQPDDKRYVPTRNSTGSAVESRRG